MNLDLREKIAKTAYSLYTQRGMIDGHDIDDWLRAERIVIEQHSKKGRNRKYQPRAAKEALSEIASRRC